MPRRGLIIQSENQKKEMWFWILVKGVLLEMRFWILMKGVLQEMWFWILVKGVLLHRASVPAKQQRFHFIDVHASWKCSSMIY